MSFPWPWRKKSGVECDPDLLHGAPHIRGTRLFVFTVLEPLHRGASLAECKRDWGVDRRDVRAALLYCRKRQCLADNPPNYCSGCAMQRERSFPSFDEFKANFRVIDTIEEFKVRVPPYRPVEMSELTAAFEMLRRTFLHGFGSTSLMTADPIGGRDATSAFIGSLDDLREYWQGAPGWEWAEEAYRRLLREGAIAPEGE